MARCWHHSSANRTATRCGTARSPWCGTTAAPSSATSTRNFRSARRIMPRSPRRRPMRSIRQRRRGGDGCIAFWNTSTTGLPGGAPRVTQPTGVASSTSTLWWDCVSRMKRCSTRRTRRCCVFTKRGCSTVCGSIMSMVWLIRPAIVAGFARDSMNWRASGRRMRRKVQPGWSSRRSSAPVSACRMTGRWTAPVATTSWIR